MNFEKIPPVRNSQDLMNSAFRKAREKSTAKEKTREEDWHSFNKKKESAKLDYISSQLQEDLGKIITDFPESEALPNFYLQIMNLTIDLQQFKKSFGAIAWAVQKIKFLHREYIHKIIQAKEKHFLILASREFYGRVSSVLKQIDSNLKYLEDARKIMKTYPDIKEMFTVCIYGFPNVGKTTLLNQLTGTRAKVAAYAFTTKSINAGYLKHKDKTLQILDVPGTLSRSEKMNPIEMQAELVLQELAKVVIFVFDLSKETAYSLEDQEKLLDKIHQKKKVLVYLSKKDIMDPELVAEFKHKHYSVEELKEKILEISEKELDTT